MASEPVTHQRMYVSTKKKLDSLSKLENRSNPRQLKVMIDIEFDRKFVKKGEEE